MISLDLGLESFRIVIWGRNQEVLFFFFFSQKQRESILLLLIKERKEKIQLSLLNSNNPPIINKGKKGKLKGFIHKGVWPRRKEKRRAPSRRSLKSKICWKWWLRKPEEESPNHQSFPGRKPQEFLLIIVSKVFLKK